jgi:hypothetical protein
VPLPNLFGACLLGGITPEPNVASNESIDSLIVSRVAPTMENQYKARRQADGLESLNQTIESPGDEGEGGDG